MKASKNLGIWMDYSTAYLIDPEDQDIHTIQSEFSSAVKEEALTKGEKHMHNKEQQFQEAYFNEIGEKVLEYDEVLLFGPTNAKAAFHNHLDKNMHFRQVKIEVEPADKMTENEKKAFVKKHFLK